MKIIIEIIPHNEQRYNTCGDWHFFEDGTLNIRVSDMKDPFYELLVAQHEMIEALLCRKKGITQDDVDRFDMEFMGEGEPGDDPKAPYHEEHLIASHIERYASTLLKVDWNTYEDAICKLG